MKMKCIATMQQFLTPGKVYEVNVDPDNKYGLLKDDRNRTIHLLLPEFGESIFGVFEEEKVDRYAREDKAAKKFRDALAKEE